MNKKSENKTNLKLNNHIKIGGIISEYNPFHNGHKYQIEEFKDKYDISHVVVALSGNFVQRGGPSILDKYSRAEMAIVGGADLVIEIPAYFSTQTAQLYARGSVMLLDSLRCVDSICFGSEYGNIDKLEEVANLLYEKNDEIDKHISKYIKDGFSYPLAREKAVYGFINDLSDDFMKKSNNILGIEYISELKRLGSKIKPTTIKRIGSSHKESELEGNVSSATSIRKGLLNNSIDYVADFIPKTSYDIIKKYLESGYCMLSEEDFFENICVDVIKKCDNLVDIFEIKNGLENSIYQKCPISENLISVEDLLSSPQYTRNRVRRSLFNILLDVYEKDIETVKSLKSMPYIRVLAFNDNGREILKQINQNSNSEVVLSVAKAIKGENYRNNEIFRLMMDFDLKSSSIYYQKACRSNRKLLSRGMIDFISLKTML